MSPDDVQRLSKAASMYLKSCEDKLEEIVERLGESFRKNHLIHGFHEKKNGNCKPMDLQQFNWPD